MLLNLLTKEEKINFLELVLKVNSLNNEVSDFEKRTLDKYKAEMGDDILKFKRSNKTPDQVIAFFKDKSKLIKNIVYYNITWLSLCDDYYCVEQHEVLDKMVEEFGITKKKKEEIQKAVYADRDLRELIKRVIYND